MLVWYFFTLQANKKNVFSISTVLAQFQYALLKESGLLVLFLEGESPEPDEQFYYKIVTK